VCAKFIGLFLGLGEKSSTIPDILLFFGVILIAWSVLDEIQRSRDE